MSSVQWLGHAATKIEHSGNCVLIDPWLSNPKAPETKPEIKNLKAILITHGHFDHVGDTLSLAKEHPDAKIYVIHELTYKLKKEGVPEAALVGCNKGGSFEVAPGMQATFVTAVHSSGCAFAGEAECSVGGEAGGWVVQAGSTVYYHGGDTDAFGDMAVISDLYKPTVALLCIGGHYTMGPKGCAYSLQNLLKTVTTVIPIHYGTFPPLKGTPAELSAFLAGEYKPARAVEVKAIAPGDSLTF